MAVQYRCKKVFSQIACPFFRFPGQQVVTKLVTAPMACSTVMVPTSMFMGQVVTAYSPFAQQQGQAQAMVAPSDSQQQLLQPQGLTQPQQQQPFLQVKHTVSTPVSDEVLEKYQSGLGYLKRIWFSQDSRRGHPPGNETQKHPGGQV